MIHRWEGWLRVIWGHFLGCAGPRGLSGEGAEGMAPHYAGWAGSGLQLTMGGSRAGNITPLPRPVIYGTRAELGDAPGTLGRAEWVGRNSTEHSVDLLLEAQVWSPREVVGVGTHKFLHVLPGLRAGQQKATHRAGGSEH